MPGSLRAPEKVQREIMREDSVQAWREPVCEICSQVFGRSTCQLGSFSKLRIVEEFNLDGTHTVHIVAPSYLYADLVSMQVFATLDDVTYKDPFTDAVKVLAHLGFHFDNGVIAEIPETA